MDKIQRTQDEALNIITGSSKMSDIDQFHSENKMLQVKNHPNLLSAQCPIHCLDIENVCHHITTMDHSPKQIKEILFIRHNQTQLRFCHCILLTLTKANEPDGFFKLSRLWNGSAGCSPLGQLHCYRIDP